MFVGYDQREMSHGQKKVVTPREGLVAKDVAASYFTFGADFEHSTLGDIFSTLRYATIYSFMPNSSKHLALKAFVNYIQYTK